MSACRECGVSVYVKKLRISHYNAAWRRANPDYQRAYQRENRERIRKVRKAYDDKKAEGLRAYREANAERRRQTAREWRAANPERKKVADKAYASSAEGRLAIVLKHNRRRAMKASAPGVATNQQVRARIQYYGGLCYLCGASADTLDHVIPLSKGGSNWAANIRPACGSCNSRKGTSSLSVFRASLRAPLSLQEVTPL